MEYERIDKVQVGVISPSKLRMKLLGAQHFIRKEERSTSCRTSPSRAEELDSAKSSLLEGDLHEEVGYRDPQNTSSTEQPSTEKNSGCTTGANQNGLRISSSCKSVPYSANYSNNLNAMQSSRVPEEDGNNGYDSGHDNASTSSFEFHRGERILQHPSIGPFSRNMPSKWNDAEKWLVSRQLMHLNGSKKMVSHNQGRRPVICNDTKTEAPESISRIVVEKFSFLPRSSSTRSASKISGLSNQSTISDDCSSTPRLLGLHEIKESSQSVTSEPKVSMRDIGTEMTPIASQDPSRTGTPMDSTTPIRSPISSIPSTPRRGAPTTSPVKTNGNDEPSCGQNVNNVDLSESQLQLQTRKEIVALGLQLGKTNIASWASKDELYSASLASENQHMKAEFEARAAAWEEAEKCKHMARFKGEEVKIQAWEGHQKAKFEAKLRKIEAKVEQMKVHAHERMVERLAITRQKAEEKHATARAKVNRQAARTANQVEQIRQTGRTPSTHLRCCNWFL